MSGEQEKCALIVPRRNFLIRALGFTAVGASVPVPVLALDTPESRLEHHIKGAVSALEAIHPECKIAVERDGLSYKRKGYFGHYGIVLTFSAEHRDRAEKHAEYLRAQLELKQRFGM